MNVETRDHGPKNIAKNLTHPSRQPRPAQQQRSRRHLDSLLFCVASRGVRQESGVLGEPGACKLIFYGSPSRFGCDVRCFLFLARETPQKNKASSLLPPLPCFTASLDYLLSYSMQSAYIFCSFLSLRREHSRSDPTSRDHRKATAVIASTTALYAPPLLLPWHREEARRRPPLANVGVCAGGRRRRRHSLEMMEGTPSPETLVSVKGFDLRAGISAGSNQSSHANLGYV